MLRCRRLARRTCACTSCHTMLLWHTAQHCQAADLSSCARRRPAAQTRTHMRPQPQPASLVSAQDEGLCHSRSWHAKNSVFGTRRAVLTQHASGGNDRAHPRPKSHHRNVLRRLAVLLPVLILHLVVLVLQYQQTTRLSAQHSAVSPSGQLTRIR